MVKEAYYFSHDANAQHDFKIIKLRRELGWEGYGLFWALIENLRCEPDYKLPLSSLEDLAFTMQVSKEKLHTIISRYGLFEIDENFFFSIRLIRSMDDYNTKKIKLVEAGRKGGLSRAKASLEHRSSKEKKEKEKKLKEIKEKEIVIVEATSRQTFTPPVLDELTEYMKSEKQFDPLDAAAFAEKFISFYESKGWMIGKNKMKNWKMAVNTWLQSPEYKNKQIDYTQWDK